MSTIQTVGVIGCGVIGAGWATRYLAQGLDVIAWDPAPDAEDNLRAAVARAWPAVCRLGVADDADPSRLRFSAQLEPVCEHADFIQESAPERLELKRQLHTQMDAAARAEVIIASSTSGLLPSDFQADCAHPERILVGHPFNPVYLLPLVEVLGGQHTAADVIDQALQFYQRMGMYPLHVRKEIPGFLSDRLQEALWREALHLIHDDVATVSDIDAAIAYGPGLRWSIWGTCMIFHLAGGEGGIRHMLNHFDPSLFPWTQLEPPPITEELIERMEQGCEQQAAGQSIQQLEQLRDQCLIDIMRALETYQVGAGKVLADQRKQQEID